MDGGSRHLANKASGCSIIGGGEAINLHNVLMLLQPPVIESGVLLQVPEGLGADDVDKEADGLDVALL